MEKQYKVWNSLKKRENCPDLPGAAANQDSVAVIWKGHLYRGTVKPAGEIIPGCAVLPRRAFWPQSAWLTRRSRTSGGDADKRFPAGRL